MPGAVRRSSMAIGQLRVALIGLLEGLGPEPDRARNALPALVA